MARRVRISVERVRELEQQRQQINRLPLGNIIWPEGGRDVEVDGPAMVQFMFSGLSNTDFIMTGSYDKAKEV